MFCPNFTNKEVFDQFNEIIEAFGGRAMTADEFRSVELRNQRSGSDLIAMLVAYTLWNLNNGNPIDLAPNGKESKLFSDLLSNFNGDREMAIRVKADLYGDNFINWFGDWLSEDKTNVSKVVDENGEPLVVYHRSGVDNIDIFDLSKSKRDKRNLSFAYHFGTKKASEEIEVLEEKDATYAVFLNIKNEMHWDDLSQGEWVRALANIRKRGIINDKEFESFRDYKHTKTPQEKLDLMKSLLSRINKDGYSYINNVEDVGSKSWAVFNPNQIKSINNNGEWSTIDPNINHMAAQQENLESFAEDANILLAVSASNPEVSYGEVYQRLRSGEIVSSRELLQTIIDGKLAFGANEKLANILKNKDIPVRMVSTNAAVVASTITNKNGSVVLINDVFFSQCSNDYATTSILHEVMHAVTVNAINNPKTTEEKAFRDINRRVFEFFDKLLPAKSFDRMNVGEGFYALTNEKEFAASFLTDEAVRLMLYDNARLYDKQKHTNRAKSILGRFVRAVVNLFTKNTSSAENMLQEYQSFMEKYVRNQATDNTPVDKQLLMRMYDKVDQNSQLVDQYLSAMRSLNLSMQNAEINNIRRASRSQSVAPTSQSKMNAELIKSVAEPLKLRLLALKSAVMKEDERTKLVQGALSLISLFENEKISKYIAITDMLMQVGPQIMNDCQSLLSIKYAKTGMSDAEFLYQLHDNFKTYQSILRGIKSVLSDPEFRAELLQQANQLNTGEEAITLDDINAAKEKVDVLSDNIEEGISALLSIIKHNMRNITDYYAEESESSDLENYYDNFIAEGSTSIYSDISALEKMFGARDSSKNELLRLLSHIVNLANDDVEKSSFEKAVDLLEAQQALKFGESVDDLYERLENGETTGYAIRKRNYGKFYKDYDAFLVQLNADTNKKYNLKLDKNNRMAPEDEAARLYWQTQRNEWLDKHCDRKYDKEYYQAWAGVSNETRLAMEAINSRIFAINNKPGVIGEDGYPHYEKLSAEERRELLDLQTQKRLLKSEYDEFGNKKEGIRLKMAQEILQLYDKLYGTKNKIVKDVKAWKKARKKVIEECGGEVEYQKFIHDEDNNFDGDRLKFWDSINSSYEFKQDEETGELLVFLAIEDAAQGIKPYYGEEYDRLSLEERDLLKPYRRGTDYVSSLIPQAIKNKVKEIERQKKAIQKEATEHNKTLKQQQETYGAIFNQFIQFVDTEEFKREKQRLAQELNGDPELSQLALGKFGTLYYDFQLGIVKNFRPYKWLQKMEARDEFKNAYMELKPSDSWLDKSHNKNHLNDKFLDSEGTTFVPKLDYVDERGKRVYDNSKQYDKVQNSKTLKNLYDKVISTMDESNAMQTNRTYTDKYLLPQVLGSLWKKVKNKKGWFGLRKVGAFFKHIGEKIGLNGITNNDVDYGNTSVSETDETGSETNSSENKTSVSSGILGSAKNLFRGTRPDGRTYNTVPQFYTKKLDDPTEISADLVGIVYLYYKMSKNYKEMSAIKDKCETIVDMIGDMTFANEKTPQREDYKDEVDYRNALERFNKSHKETLGDHSNIYDAAQTFLEMNLYDIRQNRLKIGEFEATKFVGEFRKWITATNLGLNPKVSAVGLLVAQWTHLINAITGQKYGKGSYMKAGLDVMYQTVKNILSLKQVRNSLSNNDLIVFMEYWNNADLLEKKLHHTNRTTSWLKRIPEAIAQNYCFGLMSGADFLMKSTIMESVMYEYKFVDGQFITTDDIYLDARAAVGKNDPKLMKQWIKQQKKKYRNAPSLRSLCRAENHRFVIDEQYKEAFKRKEHVIRQRIKKYSEHADGMATNTQKAAITNGMLGSFLLIHRQYLPLMIQERLSEPVYDYDMHLYKNGLFRIVLQFVMNLMRSNLLLSMGIGAGTLTALSGATIGLPAGIAVGTAVNLIHKYNRRRGASKDVGSVKDIVSEFGMFDIPFANKVTGDNSTIQKSHKSLQNKYAVKLVMAELILFSTLLSPAINFICAWADDSDDDDKWWKQMLAFIACGLEWESLTPYRANDIFSNIKSPSAATGQIDKLEAFETTSLDALQDYLKSRLIDTSGGWWQIYESISGLSSTGEETEEERKKREEEEEKTSTVSRGAYKGWKKWQRDGLKLFAPKNMFEQITDSETKRRYYENKMLKNKHEDSAIFEMIYGRKPEKKSSSSSESSSSPKGPSAMHL